MAHSQRQAAEGARRDAVRMLRVLEGKRLVLTVRANAQGTLFAAVTPVELSAILKTEGFDVPARAITFEEPIKRIGEHRVVIDFGHQGHITCTVVVKSTS